MNKVLQMILFLSLQIGIFNAVHASSVTALNNGTIVAMPNLNLLGVHGPISQAPGIAWSSTASSAFGYSGGYGFASNGFWNNKTMVGLDSGSGTMEYHFNTALTGVGGFLNYASNGNSPWAATPIISIFDSSHSLLDSLTLNFNTGGGLNSGEFHGFSLNSPLISYFSLSGSYIGLADLTVDYTVAPLTPPSQVPVPAAVWLFGSAFTGLIGMGKRKKLQALRA